MRLFGAEITQPWFFLAALFALPALWWSVRSSGRVVFSSLRALPAGGNTWRTRFAWLPDAMIALAVVGSGTVLVLRAAAARRKVIARRSAYDEAVARLTQLEERGAPEAAQADAWFVDLSGIVRGYLEHRYEIRAPELTTEEFLLVASQANALTADHRALLSAFLERCDRVKFAGYRPDSEESLASLGAARAFVEDTRLEEVAA